MNAGTWVALILGLGSLGVTVLLDARNRQERKTTAELNDTDRAKEREAERAERSRDQLAREAQRTDDRWSRDKQAAYANLCGEVFAWFDDISDRDSRRFAMTPGSTWAQGDHDRWRQVIAARGMVDLLAPSTVRDASTLAITAMTLYAGEVRMNTNPLAVATERTPALQRAAAMRDAMRADLGVPESAPMPEVGSGTQNP